MNITWRSLQLEMIVATLFIGTTFAFKIADNNSTVAVDDKSTSQETSTPTTLLDRIIATSDYTADHVGRCCYFDKDSSPNWQVVDCDKYTHDLLNCGRNCNFPDRVCPYYEMQGGICRIGYKCCSGEAAGCAGLSEGDSCRDASSRIEPEKLARNHYSGGTCKSATLCQDEVQGELSALSCEGATATDARFWPTVVWSVLYSVLGILCLASVIVAMMKKKGLFQDNQVHVDMEV